MKNITLIVPKLEDYYYEQKLNEDPSTMNYNAGYDLPLKGYHYDTGCIDFPKTVWKEKYQKRITENKYFAYIYLFVKQLISIIKTQDPFLITGSCVFIFKIIMVRCFLPGDTICSYLPFRAVKGLFFCQFLRHSL